MVVPVDGCLFHEQPTASQQLLARLHRHRRITGTQQAYRAYSRLTRHQRIRGRALLRRGFAEDFVALCSRRPPGLLRALLWGWHYGAPLFTTLCFPDSPSFRFYLFHF